MFVFKRGDISFKADSDHAQTEVNYQVFDVFCRKKLKTQGNPR